MWIIFGWLLGRGVRGTWTPDSVKQERYDRLQERQDRRRETRAAIWANPLYRRIIIIGTVAFLVYCYAR